MANDQYVTLDPERRDTAQTAVARFYPSQFPPLETVTQPTVTTEAAAFYLNRRPQTLRCWAMRGEGLLQPLRLHGRLHWRTADLARILLGVA